MATNSCQVGMAETGIQYRVAWSDSRETKIRVWFSSLAGTRGEGGEDGSGVYTTGRHSALEEEEGDGEGEKVTVDMMHQEEDLNAPCRN